MYLQVKMVALISATTLLATLTCLSFYAIALMKDVREDLEDHQKRVAIIEKETVATLNSARHAAETLRDASKEQKDYYANISKDADVTVRAVAAMIQKTDHNVNVVLLPQLAESLKNSDTNVTAVSQAAAVQLTKVGEGLVPVLAQTQQTLADLDEKAKDPNIQKTVANLQVMTLNGAAAVKQTELAAEDWRQVSDYYKKRLTTPAGFFRTLLDFVLQRGSQAATIVRAR